MSDYEKKEDREVSISEILKHRSTDVVRIPGSRPVAKYNSSIKRRRKKKKKDRNAKPKPEEEEEIVSSPLKIETGKSEPTEDPKKTNLLKLGFPPKAIEPKVRVPYKNPPNEVPRRIEIERCRREYDSMDINKLLEERNIDFNKNLVENSLNSNSYENYLPLESFDNTSFDCRRPEEWINLGKVENEDGTSSMYYIPAITLEFDETKKQYFWIECKVRDVNIEENMYFIEFENFDGTTKKCWKPRIYIMFKAENPIDFANRIAFSFKSRQEAESLLRYNLYIDNMPTDEIPPLDSKKLEGFKKRSLSMNLLKKNEDKLSVMNLLKEVIMTYERTMNKIIFDKNLLDNTHGDLFSFLSLPKSIKEESSKSFLTDNNNKNNMTKKKKYGLVKIPNYKFKINEKKFRFNTFLSEKCVIHTLLDVKEENLKKEKMRILNLKSSQRKVFNVEDFKNIQETSIKRLKEHLKDTWKLNIVRSITSNFKLVKKGWMNIYEKKLGIYNMSKLKRFMKVVKLMMEDSLRFLMEDSLMEFYNFLKEVNRYNVMIKSPIEITNEDKQEFEKKNELKKKIFSLDLLDNEKEGVFFYSTQVERYIDIIDELYMSVIEQFQEIPNVEQHVMKNLYLHGQISNLNAISLKNGLEKEYPHILEWRNKSKKEINEAIIPLKEYLKLYDIYIPLLKRDEAIYAKQFESENHALEEFRMEIQKHLREQNEVLKSIPIKIEVGTFQVDCSKVRNRLSKKCNDQAKRILDLLASLGKQKTTYITREFSKIASQLNKRVENIIVLTKVRDFMNEMAEKVSDLQKNIEEMKNYYDLLDVFKYEVGEDEFRNQCAAMSWPRKIYEQRERVEARLVKDEERFKEIMERKQEEFKSELDTIETEVSELSRRTDFSKVKENFNDIKTLQNQIKTCKQKAAKYNEKESLFGSEITEYTQIRGIEQKLQPFADLWITAYDWITWQTSWLQDPFNKLDAKKMDDDVAQAKRKIAKCVVKFIDSPPILAIAKEIQDRILKFLPNLPIIIALRNDGIRPRHWAAISKEINIRLVVGETIKNLSDILHLGLGDYIETIQKISEIAAKEYTIEDSLSKMKAKWETTNFNVKDYKETGTFVLKIDDEFQQQLDDHIAVTQTISFSAFKGEFEEEIEKWNLKLNLVSEIVDEWLNCQREWMALEPIFSSAELIKQLPNLYKKFKQVDTKFRKLMDAAHHTPAVLTFCSSDKILITFRTNNQILSQIQKGLYNYLETKRKQFARLYFLADDELLTILAKAKEPETIQPYLKKCFQNIQSVKFETKEEKVREDDEATTEKRLITWMRSNGGEEVEFVTPVVPTGSVEIWLGDVEFQMCLSMKKELRNAIIDYRKTKRNEWLLKWPGQIIVVGSSLFWTKEVTDTLTKYGSRGLKPYYKKLEKQIEDVTEILTKDVTSLDRLKLSSLLTIDVHGRDVVRTMRDNECSSIADFEWINQLRFYWEKRELEDEDDVCLDGEVEEEEEDGEKQPNYDCIVRQVEAEFVYGYEYLGNTSRLVITPLTDRIYLTLTGALKMILGGSPAGPAGTGKTETVKDLAKAVAKQCVVFNCSEGLNEFAMGKFFKGLVMSGAWACFDEFNRIDIEVLSVVAQQITTLQEAIRANLKTVEFENTNVSVDPTFAVFITMNPGYAGRTELPDNLKALFRPVACMIPDYALIAEIRLFSFGFKQAKPLSQKMVATFRLSSEQLSSQDHYDFGMRALNTVIASAGLLKRQNPSGDEEITLLRALIESNEPKFLENDVHLFQGIISDLFPETKKPKAEHGVLMEYLVTSCETLGIDPNESFLDKCIQLYQTIILRHGLMIVGLSGSGKTTNYLVLSHALTKLAQDRNREAQTSSASKKIEDKDQVESAHWKIVEKTIINPKSVTMSQLYGEYDKNTREWCDGVLANQFKKFAMSENDTLKWLIFDGPVDALWIESMNTVLDDNKKLCLVSGAIIELSESMNIIFEVEDLAVASPATVSRCGMVYMNQKNVPLESILKCWYLRIPETLHVLKEYLEAVKKISSVVLPKCIEFMMKSDIFTYSPRQEKKYLNSFFNLMDCMFKPFYMSKEELLIKNEEDKEQYQLKLKRIPKMIEPMVLFSCIWGVAGETDQKGREMFDEFFRKEILPLTSEDESFPKTGLIYDYKFHEVELTWVNWMYEEKPYNFEGKRFSDIIVPTIDTVRYKWLIRKLLLHEKHVLAVGPTGTGKTVVINETIMNLGNKYIPIQIFFSARTSVNQTQDIIDSRIERRKKGVFGPTPGMKNIIFIDDLNMPQPEEYGAQPPIELIRQWMDHKGWYEYNTEKLAFRTVIETLFVCAMGPPGGGRTAITNRLLSHFNSISFPEMQDETIYSIFHSMLDQWVKSNLVEKFHSISSDLVNSSINLYNSISKVMLPTPSRSHYTFNLRDIAKVFQGMMDANPKKIFQIRDILRLWIHECRRVFQDRLVDEIDRNKFEELMMGKLEGTFEVHWTDIVDKDQRLLYGDYMSPTSVEKKAYEEVVNMDDLVRDMMGQLEYYNSTNENSMDLVLFLDAIEHVSRISRILRQKGGHALLLGVGGSGRKSATKLASFMADYHLFQIEIVKGYGKKDWRDFLKGMMLKTGLNDEDQEFVFLFCDNEIIQEGFLEDINNMLNSGDVPNIYEPADFDEIYTTMKKVCRLEKLPMNPTSWFSRYVKRVRNNLHIVIAMSPQGEIFRNRLRMFPSLVNCCTIDWFSNWPVDALVSVAKEKLKSMVLGKDRNNVLEMCAFTHRSVEKMSEVYFKSTGRKNYVTPTSYLELLSTFIALHSESLKDIDKEKTKFEQGLETLKETEKEVDQLQKELKEKKPILIATQEQIRVNVEKIKKDKIIADETEVRIKAHQEKVAKKESECAEYKSKCEAELNEALPALKIALQDLKKLKREDIREVGGYKHYSEGIIMTLEAVCIMFNIRPERIKDPKNPGNTTLSYEEPGRRFCKRGDEAIKDMINYDVDNIPKRIISRIKKIVENKEEFNPARVARASVAAKSMCQFVIAMFNYYHCKKKIEPLEFELKKAEDVLTKVANELKVANEELESIQAKIEFLNNENIKSMKKQKELAEKVQNCNIRLTRARKLTQGLASEKNEWVKNLLNYRQREKNIIGDMLLGAGAVAYFGSFSHEFRLKLRKEWIEQLEIFKILFDPTFDLTNLIDPVTIQKWVRDEGLPFDNLSVQNAVILNTVFKKASFRSSDSKDVGSIKWPLFIDPQLQANKWIKSREKGNLKVINLNQKDYMRDLLNGIQFGTPVLIENVGETLNPDIEPILVGQKTLKGGTYYIKIGESEYHYNSSFRLYITTKLRNPHYAPETSCKVTLLNFFITPEGLADQLLGTVVAMERPELERMKIDLMENNMKFAEQLREFQNQILQTLDEGKTDILGSDHLIRALQQSQHKSRQVEEKLVEAKKTEKEIDITRDKYKRVAKRGSTLFFCVSDMANIDPMYQYSLQWFIDLFKHGVTQAEESEDLNVRIMNLIDFFTYSLYSNVCQSLFEKHKMLYSFILTIRILFSEKVEEVDKLEWRYFLTGSSKHKPPNVEIKYSEETEEESSSEWITEKIWNEVLNCSTLEFFGKDFLDSFLNYSQRLEWESFYNRDDVISAKIPFKTEEITPFRRLLILRVLRPDKVAEFIIDFVTFHMGKKFVEPPRFDLIRSFKNSSNKVPLVFILSPGADPKYELDRFAESLGKKHFDSVSLGRGTERKATDAVREASKSGNWVLLQNCHLAKSYMRALEALVEENSVDEDVHIEFRLWLTSMPDQNFPVSILQNSVKMTLEPPKGMRANLLRSYGDFNDRHLEHVTKPIEFKKLLFSLCFFHAVVQERRKFGPLGWNRCYEFTKGDLEICIRQLRMFLENYEQVPYQIIRFLSGEINYGGRVTDDWDRRTIKSIINTFICKDVLKDDYQFSELEEYKSIAATDHQGYINYLENLPSLTSPIVLGFHKNAIITSNTSEFNSICDTVLSMIPKGSSSGASEMSAIQKKSEEFLKIIPLPFDLKKVMEQFPTKYEESMNTVIVQEVEKYSKLLKLIHKTLNDIIKAIKGLVVMSSELEEMGMSIFDNQVPNIWKRLAYPSEMPLHDWILNLITRCEFINNWVTSGETPTAFWISGFYFPQGFLTGILQNYARKYKVAIDQISFDFKILSNEMDHRNILQKPEDGCLIYGLFLEGARFNRITNKLDESKQKVLYEKVPIIQLVPRKINLRENKESVVENYICPLYKTLRRAGTLSTTGHSTNFIIGIEVPSDRSQKHWVERGVAMICSLNYHTEVLF